MARNAGISGRSASAADHQREGVDDRRIHRAYRCAVAIASGVAPASPLLTMQRDAPMLRSREKRVDKALALIVPEQRLRAAKRTDKRTRPHPPLRGCRPRRCCRPARPGDHRRGPDRDAVLSEAGSQKRRAGTATNLGGHETMAKSCVRSGDPIEEADSTSPRPRC